jgi:betaine-aldehyde dehydrogenase
LISEEQMEKVLGHIARGKSQGARVVTGGYRVTTGDLANGFFVAPTVFAASHDDMAIAREEIFGPVMTVLGLGRENGRAAIEHYTQLKSVYVAMVDVEAPY